MALTVGESPLSLVPWLSPWANLLSRWRSRFIEYQNEFTTEGGKLHDAVKACMVETDMLAKSASLAAAARSKGVKVFHAPIAFKEDASDNPNKNLGILAGCAADKLFTEGTWNADFHPMMQPQDGDVVVRQEGVGASQSEGRARRATHLSILRGRRCPL